MPKEQAVEFLDHYKKNRDLMEKVEQLFAANPDKSDGELWAMAVST